MGLRVGFLCSSRVENVVSESAVRAAVERASQLVGYRITFETISADDLTAEPAVDLLIYGPGRYFSEATWLHVRDYFRRGGHLLTVGCFPLTIPYRIQGDGVVKESPTDAALHSLAMVDTCVSTGECDRPIARDIAPRFAFLKQVALPPMRDTCSMDVRLATRPEPDQLQYARHGVREADLEVGCCLHDEADRVVAAPIIRIHHYDGGALTFLNFEPVDDRFYDLSAGQEFLGHIITASLQEAWRVTLSSRYARYRLDEMISITLGGRRLRGAGGQSPRRIELSVFDADVTDGEPLGRKEIDLPNDQVEHVWDGIDVPEGSCVVTARLRVGECDVQEWRTGFYVLSDERAKAIAGNAPRFKVDPSIAPDYCVVGDTPLPMTGTTYMARDNFRDCFADLNVAYARLDLAGLRDLGANIIRAGVWTTYGRIYHSEGGFREEALRSMDAYFLAAAEAGLPVQFVPSAFVMNCWNREGSVFHDPELRAKAMKCFEQFAQRYADWPGVQLDVINEPSYAPFRQGQLWQLARPIGDEYELKSWRAWLHRRYNGDIGLLRLAWAITSAEVRSFDEATLPEEEDFATNYDGPPTYTRRAMLTDFYEFAADSFAGWSREIRRIVREHAPSMLVMIGHDEWFRVPTQQREAYEGNIDLVNWHQWHWEGVIFNEYNLNRVRGLPCCGQEMGILCYKDQRNAERISETEMRDQLERKLIYCLGNWIQWQSHCDPVMDVYKENRLGFLRVDGTERRMGGLIRLLGFLEKGMARRLMRRREDREQLAIVIPTSVWFSSDKHLAVRATRQAFTAMHYYLKRQPYTILEDLLCDDNRVQIGWPAVVVVPSPTLLRERAWQHLLKMVHDEGVTLLVTGSIQQDEYWRRCERLAKIGIQCETSNLATVERLRVSDRTYDCTFREAINCGLPAKGLLRAVPGDAGIGEPVEIQMGTGRIIYCPVPVELADDIEPTVSLYQQTLHDAADLPSSPVEIDGCDNSASQFIYAIEYEDCTAVSLVNEGTDATFRFRLTGCGCEVEAELACGRAAKLYVDGHGGLVGGYIHSGLRVGETHMVPGGDLAFVKKAGGWVLLPGERTDECCEIDGRRVGVKPFVPTVM